MIEPIDFLNFAEGLLQEGEEEIVLRNSISRAYYYAFHYVRENCRGHPSSRFRMGPGDHQEAVAFFKRVKKGDLASWLYSIRSRRIDADYELKKNFEKENAGEFIEDVKSFVSHLNSSGLV